ncbi:hypothetical protein EYZ11_010362 [Aspergillus tanneri]|uniref:Uncharacterized protein n=1 Tax=Aspergillus tanneri TaxID=1220188 RepID=A0A4S3J5V9_9EURO|nr:hypothetical protein EYZ11_010362 [Aspergillus tanneri]
MWFHLPSPNTLTPRLGLKCGRLWILNDTFSHRQNQASALFVYDGQLLLYGDGSGYMKQPANHGNLHFKAAEKMGVLRIKLTSNHLAQKGKEYEVRKYPQHTMVDTPN